MAINKKKFKFSRISQDGFPVFLTGIAIFCGFFSAQLLVQPNKNLNQGSLLIYITVATLSSSLLDPFLTLVKVEKKLSKYVSVCVGILISLSIFTYTIFYSHSLFDFLVSFSSRGGFTATSVSLLLLQLASMNYEIQSENELNKKIQKEKYEKEKEKERIEKIELKKEVIALKKELFETKKLNNRK